MGRAVVAASGLDAVRNVDKLVCDVWVVWEEDLKRGVEFP
jgi:hypothetical protein